MVLNQAAKSLAFLWQGLQIKVYLLSQRTRKISFLVDINIYLICSLSRGKARLQF